MSEPRLLPTSVPPGPPPVARIHPVNRRQFDALGAQLATSSGTSGSHPDPARRLRIDDVARMLQVDLLHAELLGWAAVAESAWRSFLFLEEAFDSATGRFADTPAGDDASTPIKATNEPFGRTMLALGLVIATAADAELVTRADALFDRALPKANRLGSARARASMVLACAAAPDAKRTALMRTMATDLHASFRSLARPGWPWPESDLTCESALLPRALIVAGRTLNATTMLAIGLQVLDWLIEVQTSPRGDLSPIGSGGWSRGGERSQYDQRPIEVTSLLLAAEAAYAATGRTRYRDTMERGYAWFLGTNDLRLRVAHPARGSSSDGLTPLGVDAHESAESTLLWLIATEHIRRSRVVGPPAPAVAPTHTSVRRRREFVKTS